MILIHGWADIRPDAHDAVAAAALGLQASSRTEAGCVHYGLSWSVDAPHRICLIEIWNDQQVYDQHTGMPYVNEFRDLAAASAAAPPTFIRYDAAPAVPAAPAAP